MLNYADSRYAFAALVPDKGISLDEYIGTLSIRKLQKILNHPIYTDVATAMPKFRMDTAIALKPHMMNMGMWNAFDEWNANFSGIGYWNRESYNVYLQSINHICSICIDECGTEAHAITSSMLEESYSLATEQRKVYLDRPYLYMIIDTRTKLPLFMGTVRKIPQ